MLRIRHTGIYVNDLTKMKEFYCACLGMVIASEATEDGRYIETLLGVPSLSLQVCKLKYPDGTMLELVKPSIDLPGDMHAGNVICQGCMHIALTVGNLQQLYEKLIGQGIPFISQPLLSPDGKVKVCFCRDPEGNYLELVQELQ